MMKRSAATWMGIVFFLAVAVAASCLAPSANAQIYNSSIVGVVYDFAGKPYHDVTLLFVDDQGKKTEVKTDKNGKYAARNIRFGEYTITVKFQDKQLFQFKERVDALQEVTHDVNLMQLRAKEGGPSVEEVKKQEEQKQKVEGMKANYEAGVVSLEKARQDRKELRSAKPDQRDTAKQKLADDANQAQSNFQAALQAAPESDSNLHLIWFRIGEARDLAGKNEEAAEAYQKAILLKPDAANYYINLGNVLANQGKIEEARAAYQKSADLDPLNAAMAYRNFGIVLSNLGRMKEALEPLRKSTVLEPKSAQGWYLLAGALLGTGEQKQVGDKMTYEVSPETAEAYQKAIDLDPNGPIGRDAKAGLDALAQLAPGIQTKINTKKKKS